MRYAQSISLTATPVSLADALINVGRNEDSFHELTLRAVGGTANLGNQSAQPLAIAAADGIVQFRHSNNLRNVYVSGTGSLVVVVT